MLPVLRIFARRSLRRDWKSEGSAAIYCRCRALPLVISFSENFDPIIEEHLLRILSQLKEVPERFGIGEADPEEQTKDDWSPPNAFHTYWVLDVLSKLERTFPTEYTRISSSQTLDFQLMRAGMLSWARERLGYEISLHSEPKSSVLDTDQLAWSLAIFLRFDSNFHSDLAKQDLIRQAFRCLFSTQNNVGTWPHYKPLFHYRDAGNAYCYVFETFAVLLHHCALKRRAEAEVIRGLLRPYGAKLLDLWRYAVSTQIPLGSNGKVIGWSSGHRINNPGKAESWATASVFSYAQALRRVIGIWCREDALASLSRPQERRSRRDAANEMAARGETWGINKTSVSEQLWTLFINPTRLHKCSDRLEPDSRPIREAQARSAILFGPPGTSKTTLIRSLADVIGWQYVEIHASHFVAEGLNQVQKTADAIFKQLSELDHTVVLFDEIDELVREREMERDAFGRFLTTSMLPKLAELWEERKILYFVATNHITYFDSAIIRSHRFDALMLVSPPSFRVKIERISQLLSTEYGLNRISFDISENQVHEELQKLRSGQTDPTNREADEKQWRERPLNPELALAKFALLRFDELDELAFQLSKALLISSSPVPRRISVEMLRTVLNQIADSEWRKNKSYSDFLRDIQCERRDYQMLNVWEVVGKATDSVPEIHQENGRNWLAKATDVPRDVAISGFELHFEPFGRVYIRPSRKNRPSPASVKKKKKQRRRIGARENPNSIVN
jgi:hypothetical protein